MLSAVRDSVPRRIVDPAAFGRVAVMLGGRSSEREVSLKSGKAVLDALKRRGVDALGVRSRRSAALGTARRSASIACGSRCTDRAARTAPCRVRSSCSEVPYTGSGVLGSAIGMDKLRTKRLAQAVGIATPDYLVLREAADLDSVPERLGLPVFIKPAFQGSSVGVARVDRAEQLRLPGARRCASMPWCSRRPASSAANTPSRCCRGGAAFDPHRDRARLL